MAEQIKRETQPTSPAPQAGLERTRLRTHQPGRKQIFRSLKTRGTCSRVKISKKKRRREKKKKKKHRVFWLVPPCFKSSSVFHLSAEAAAESKQRQCKPLRLDFLHVSSEMCTNCPTTLRMRCGRVLRFLSTGFILQWNIYKEHFTAGVFALQLDLKLNGSVLRLRHRQQQQQHFSSIKTHHVTNVCFFFFIQNPNLALLLDGSKLGQRSDHQADSTCTQRQSWAFLLHL